MAAVVAVGFSIGAYGVQPYAALNLPQGAHHPVLSPDGNIILFSADTHDGLKAYDISTGEVTTIDEAAAAGYQPVFSADGATVYYRTSKIDDGLLYRDVRSFSFADGRQHCLAPHSRDNVNVSSLSGSDFAVADYNCIRVHSKGVESVVSPLSDSHSYLWASLSPDGTKILFTEPFKGVFIANADGTDARRVMRRGDNPAWAGNGTVVAVITHDDGYVVLDSRLVAVDVATGNVTALTDDTLMVGEATAAPDGKVVFSDIKGNMFIFNLND